MRRGTGKRNTEANNSRYIIHFELGRVNNLIDLEIKRGSIRVPLHNKIIGV